MSKTVTRKCTCKHDYQDEKLGKGYRIFNCTKDNKDARCTVCQSKISVGGGSVVETKKTK